MANSNSPRQIQIHHSKFKIHHGKFKFTTIDSKSLLTVRFATGVGLVLGGFRLFLVVHATFCWGLSVVSGSSRYFLLGASGPTGFWSLPDLGPLLLLVRMGNPWISGLPYVGWLWPFVGGKDSLCHALWSSFVLGVSEVFAFGHG